MARNAGEQIDLVPLRGLISREDAREGRACGIGCRAGRRLPTGNRLYGVAALDFLGGAEVTFYRTIATSVMAINEGENPKDVVTVARRGVSTDCRPSLTEMAAIYTAADAA